MHHGVEKEIFIDENLSAPLEYNEKVGYINYKLNNEIIATVDVVTKDKVEKKKWGNFYAKIFDEWFSIGRL